MSKREISCFFIISLLCMLFAQVFTWWLYWLFDEIPTSTLERKGDVYVLVFAVSLGPILETLIFNKWINSLFMLILRRKNLALFVSSAMFALAHYSGHLYHVLLAFSSGIILQFFYNQLSERKSNKFAFWLTCLLHASWNLFVVLKSLDVYLAPF